MRAMTLTLTLALALALALALTRCPVADVRAMMDAVVVCGAALAKVRARVKVRVTL